MCPVGSAKDSLHGRSTLDRKHASKALVDSGASACYINKAVSKPLGIRSLRRDPVQLQYADGSTAAVAHETADCVVAIAGTPLKSTMRFTIVPFLSYPLILGHSWLRRHNPRFDGRTSSIVLRSPMKGRNKALSEQEPPHSHMSSRSKAPRLIRAL